MEPGERVREEKREAPKPKLVEFLNKNGERIGFQVTIDSGVLLGGDEIYINVGGEGTPIATRVFAGEFFNSFLNPELGLPSRTVRIPFYVINADIASQFVGGVKDKNVAEALLPNAVVSEVSLQEARNMTVVVYQTSYQMGEAGLYHHKDRVLGFKTDLVRG